MIRDYNMIVQTLSMLYLMLICNTNINHTKYTNMAYLMILSDIVAYHHNIIIASPLLYAIPTGTRVVCVLFNLGTILLWLLGRILMPVLVLTEVGLSEIHYCTALILITNLTRMKNIIGETWYTIRAILL